MKISSCKNICTCYGHPRKCHVYLLRLLSDLKTFMTLFVHENICASVNFGGHSSSTFHTEAMSISLGAKLEICSWHRDENVPPCARIVNLQAAPRVSRACATNLVSVKYSLRAKVLSRTVSLVKFFLRVYFKHLTRIERGNDAKYETVLINLFYLRRRFTPRDLPDYRNPPNFRLYKNPYMYTPLLCNPSTAQVRKSERSGSWAWGS